MFCARSSKIKTAALIWLLLSNPVLAGSSSDLTLFEAMGGLGRVGTKCGETFPELADTFINKPVLETSLYFMKAYVEEKMSVEFGRAFEAGQRSANVSELYCRAIAGVAYGILANNGFINEMLGK